MVPCAPAPSQVTTPDRPPEDVFERATVPGTPGGSARGPTVLHLGERNRPAWFSTDWFLGAQVEKSMKRKAGDPAHNLWAVNGPLDKLDRVEAARGRRRVARKCELRSAEANLNHDASWTTKKDWWFGNCDHASSASWLWPRPERSVRIDDVEFTPRDIEGLLTCVAREVRIKPEYHGDRGGLLSPEAFLANIEHACSAGGGVVVLGKGGQIFNRPFARATVRMFSSPPVDWKAGAGPIGRRSNRRWYEFELECGDRTRTWRAWVEDSCLGRPRFRYLGDRAGPQFVWVPSSKATWPPGLIGNRQIDAALVRAIYEQSITPRATHSAVEERPRPRTA